VRWSARWSSSGDGGGGCERGGGEHIRGTADDSALVGATGIVVVGAVSAGALMTSVAAVVAGGDVATGTMVVEVVEVVTAAVVEVVVVAAVGVTGSRVIAVASSQGESS
jgi:hypothetical protein